MLTTAIFKKFKNSRGSIENEKILENTFIKRISQVIRFGNQTSIYKSKVSSGDLNTAQILVLSLLYALSTGDMNSCLILIQISTSLDHLKSKYLTTWLLNDYNFDRQSVENGLKMFKKLISQKIMKVPTDLITIFSILARKYIMDSNNSLDDRLCTAVHNNNVAELILLATKGANINLRTPYGDSLYHFAVSGCSIESIRVLHYLKADIEGRDRKYETPLLKAVIADNKEVVRALLLAGADTKNLFVGGNQIIHIAAIKHCNDALEVLLESSEVNVHNHNQQSPLMLAAQNKNIIGVKLLLKKQANPNHVDKNGETALHVACRLSCSRIVKELINAGGETNVASTAGLKPIHLCGDRATIIAMSVCKDVLDLQSTDLNTALHLAISGANDEVAEALLNVGAKVNVQNREEETPLIIAVNQNRYEMVKMLLDSGADPNVTDNEGFSAVCRAAERGGLAILQVVKAAGGYLKAVTTNNFTLLHIAVLNGHCDIVDFLLESEVLVLLNETGVFSDWGLPFNGTTATDFNYYDTPFSWTALHLACFFGYYSIVRSLLQSNASIEAIDNNNLMPLHLAAYEGNLQIIQFLLAHDAVISSKTIVSQTACHIAADRGHLEVVKFLLTKGANVNEPGFDDWTPLHHAAARKHLDIVKYLLDHGANVNSTTRSEGSTPLSLSGNYTEISSLLMPKESP